MSSWLSIILMLAAALAILGPLFWSLKSAERTPAPDAEGWIKLKATAAHHMFGAFSLILGIGFIIFGVLAIIGDALSMGSQVQIFVIVTIGMGVLFLWHFNFMHLARFQYRSDRFEYAAPFKKNSVAWNEVSEIRMSTNGPQIVTVESKVTFSNLLQGFYGLLATARENGVNIQNSPYLMQPGSFTLFGKRI